MNPNLLKELDKHIPRFIVIAGDDSLAREKIKETIVEKLYERYSDCEEITYDSSVESVQQFSEHILTPSLFQTVRIFHIRHIQKFNNADLSYLSRLMLSDFSDAYVVIEYEQQEKKTKVDIEKVLDLKKRVKKDPQRYLFLNFPKPPDYKLVQWLTEQIPLLFRRKIMKNGAECLVDLVGNDLERLYAELQKIDIHLPEDTPIDKMAVERIIGASRSMSPFELAHALTHKDTARTLTIIDSLYSENFSITACISIIFKSFWEILKVRSFLYDHPDMARSYRSASYKEKTRIAYEIGIATHMLRQTDPQNKAYPVMVLSGVIERSKEFTFTQIKQICRWLREFDVGVKTGRVNPSKQAFQLLCYRILQVEGIMSERMKSHEVFLPR